MQRRAFFGAAAAAAAVAAMPALGQAQATKASRIKQGLWKVNFGADATLTFDQECAIAARLGARGFDVIQAADWPTLRKYGLDPLMVGPGKTDYLAGLIHPEIHDQVYAGIVEQAELCARNNVKRIGLTAGQRRGLAYNVAADNAVAICKRLAPRLEAAGVILCIENVNDRRPDPDLSRADMVFGHWDWGMEVVERVASPSVKLLCDIYHLQIMDGDVTSRIRRDIKQIAHIHVAGVPARKEIDGRQELNYRMIAGVIADTGYDGYVCHEWRLTPGADPVKSIAESLAIMNV
ncbi:MAG: Xylose isomerase domain protein barrel [Caulobacteraceae bacterium]|nr:Xylose isomerase domain protein barrel [Caulobacteraceae bacterium]